MVFSFSLKPRNSRRLTIKSSSPINNKLLASIIRVNQAGEYGARQIYRGQLSVLKNDIEISEMLKHEQIHLDYFNKQVADRKVRPTLLQPLWHIGGFALGAATALMGRKAAMACTVAVEEVIGEHYDSQVTALSQTVGENELKVNIEKFCQEELEHKEIGLNHGAEQTFGFEAIKCLVKTITKTAIFLSKRI